MGGSQAKPFALYGAGSGCAKPLTPDTCSSPAHWSPKRTQRPPGLTTATFTISVRGFRWTVFLALVGVAVWLHVASNGPPSVPLVGDLGVMSRMVFRPNDALAPVSSTHYPWTGSYRFDPAALAEIAAVDSAAEAVTERGKKLLFVGIFLKPDELARRNLIRRTSRLLAPRGSVDVAFVLCDRDALEGRPEPALWAEMQTNDDMYLMNCQENMDKGKTYDFWSTISRDRPNYHYYMKADSDSYLLYHNIVLSLLHAPRQRLYLGNPVAYQDKPLYMAGMGYVLSKDLADTLVTCGEPCWATRAGPEDMRVGEWLSRTVPEPLMVADVSAEAFHIQRLQPEWSLVTPFAMVIHELKTDELWFDTHRRLVSMVDAAAVRESRAVVNWMVGPRTTVPAAAAAVGVSEGRKKKRRRRKLRSG